MSESRERRSRSRYASCVSGRERSVDDSRGSRRARSRDVSRDSGRARSGESERVSSENPRRDSRESSRNSRDSRDSWDSRRESRRRSRREGKTKSRSKGSRRSEKRTRDRSPRGGRRERSRESRIRSRSPHESRRSATTESATVGALLQTVQKLQEELSAARYRPAAQEHLVLQFDPSDDKADIEIWIQDVDRVARRGGWRGEGIICNIARHLRGHARQFFDEEQRRDPTWEVLKAALIGRFKKSLPFNRLLREAANYTAQPGQKLGDYCVNKLAKLRALKMEIPDEFLRDAVIGSIGDEAIERTVRSTKHSSVDELYAAMREMGTMPKMDTNSATKVPRFVARTPTAVAGPSGLRTWEKKKLLGEQQKAFSSCFPAAHKHGIRTATEFNCFSVYRGYNYSVNDRGKGSRASSSSFESTARNESYN